MPFKDRPAAINTGRLAPELSVQKLRAAHASMSANPLIAESMYLVRCAERTATGTLDLIRHSVEAAHPELDFQAGVTFGVRNRRLAHDRNLAHSCRTRAQTRVSVPSVLTGGEKLMGTTNHRLLKAVKVRPRVRTNLA